MCHLAKASLQFLHICQVYGGPVLANSAVILTESILSLKQYTFRNVLVLQKDFSHGKGRLPPECGHIFGEEDEVCLLAKVDGGIALGRRTSFRRRSWQSCWQRVAARRPRRRRRHWRRLRRSRPTTWATACSRPWAGARARASEPVHPALPHPLQQPPPSSPSTRAAWAHGYVLLPVPLSALEEFRLCPICFSVLLCSRSVAMRVGRAQE